MEPPIKKLFKIPYFSPKTAKLAICDKTDFCGLKYPLEVRVHYKTYSIVCGTPVRAILNHKNLTRSAGGARKGQNALVNMANKYDPNMPYFDLPWPLLPTWSNFFGPKWLVHVSHI